MSSKIAQLTADLRETTKEASNKEAAGGSLATAVKSALGGVAKEMGKFLGSKYPKAFGSFGSPYDAGYMSMGTSAEIKGNEAGRKGDIGVEAKWDPSLSKHPVVRVWTNFPGAKQFSREIAFKVSESPSSVAKRLGAAFQRDLDTWMISVVDAHNQRAAAGPVYVFRNPQNRWFKLSEKEAKKIMKGKKGEYGQKGKQEVSLIRVLPPGYTVRDVRGPTGGVGFLLWDYMLGKKSDFKKQFERMFQDEEHREKKSRGHQLHEELLKKL